MMQAIIPLEDDGYITPEIGSWGQDKYDRIKYYTLEFLSATKKRWDCRVYIDLFAGGGRGRVKGSNTILNGSPMIALEASPPFNKYIFCESDIELVDALRKRVSREHPGAPVEIIQGDVNKNAEVILANIPTPSKSFKVLSFCVVDPFKADDLKFATIERLSAIFVDFFVLIPSYMDFHRNPINYIKPGSKVVEEFLGNPDWRNAWRIAEAKGEEFSVFIVKEFGRQMARLKYIDKGLGGAARICQVENRSPLYHLALYSRSELGSFLWDEAKKYTDSQLGLPF